MTATRQRALWVLAAVAGMFLFGVSLRWGVPDEAQAQRDFLAEHPTFTVERVTPDEREVIATSFHIFYRIPGDSTLREEFRLYLKQNGKWSHRLREP